jgi:hypothetical protein
VVSNGLGDGLKQLKIFVDVRINEPFIIPVHCEYLLALQS